MNLQVISVINPAFFWGAGTHHFVGFSKERGVGWEGFVTLLNFLISPFPFFHTQHIPVLTVHVATSKKSRADHTGGRRDVRAQGRDEGAQRRDLSVPKQPLALFGHGTISVKNPLRATTPQNCPNFSSLQRAVTPNPQLASNRETLCSNKKIKSKKPH